jgi:hypothetical protein
MFAPEDDTESSMNFLVAAMSFLPEVINFAVVFAVILSGLTACDGNGSL